MNAVIKAAHIEGNNGTSFRAGSSAFTDGTYFTVLLLLKSLDKNLRGMATKNAQRNGS